MLIILCAMIIMGRLNLRDLSILISAQQHRLSGGTRALGVHPDPGHAVLHGAYALQFCLHLHAADDAPVAEAPCDG